MYSIFSKSLCALLVLLFSAGWACHAQTGGQQVYKFLDFSRSAREAALGSNVASIRDGDISLVLSNPSLITPAISKQLSLNYSNYFTDSKFGFVSYGFALPKAGNFAASMQFYNAGPIESFDEYGEPIGKVQAADYAFNLGWGRELDSMFSIGANLKAITSHIAEYNSMGMAVDVSGAYHPNESFSTTLLFRNIGRQLVQYSNAEKAPLPFEIQLALSKKLAHVPFRYSIVLQHLEKWDLTTFEEKKVDPFTGEVTNDSPAKVFSDKLFRHFVIGGEFLPARFLSFRFGYNYLRRQELLTPYRTGLTGFSLGLGIRVSKINLSYTYGAYHIAGSQSYFTLSTRLSDWSKSQKTDK